ncbi:NAD(P)H-hydrate dehydratase [Sedimentisphaera salicampi]|uniref:ADP-dependent (S)-NAD(P)H-hydrate dehydratase n=1 Tax=Sedimentisphaera salicampi TaxID=1941349 RepID=A0A1W6LJS0_9BACT|nr:NAD(P)H-hydrate dehydratase [Sedimentisphaera salicampi]ARN56038.1 Nicotinamide nucleotide repair protein [Sedimentisphaera salicampi]OXU15771.1 Nicotinamide nucleotide repair protein [Sedimentisphaera salicampi]
MNIISNIKFLEPRVSNGYKNMYGRCLVVGGSRNMSGAPVLSGKAALRSGAGLVELVVPEPAYLPASSSEPCYMVTPADADRTGKFSKDSVDEVLASAEKADVIAVGPGLGIGENLQLLISELIKVPEFNIVIDADGINNLIHIPHWPNMARANIILTPHPGEMKRLAASISMEYSPDERLENAAELSLESGTIVVLKGAESVVAFGEDCYVNNTGNPGMATGGSGDVLTGMSAALWAQMQRNQADEDQLRNAFDAAILAVYLHGAAGDIAEDKCGTAAMISSDIIEALPQAFRTNGM